MSVSYYVIDKDGVLCDEHGTPAVLTGELNEHGISLEFSEIHDGILATSAFRPIFAIHKDYAISMGLIHCYGDKFDSTQFTSLSFLAYRHVVNYLDIDTAHAISRAILLILWQADHQFCSRCGSTTKSHYSEHAMMCGRCHHRAYPRIQPCVITAITRINPDNQKRQILLALHQRHKDIGMYGLIAGFVEAGESLEQCVHREVAEEVGLKIDNIRYISSQPWPYPSNLMIGFIADYQSGDVVLQESELAEARFFDTDKLPIIPKVGTIAHALIQKVVQLA